VAAKALADNLAALMCAGALAAHRRPAHQRCNRSYAAQLLARLLLLLLLLMLMLLLLLLLLLLVGDVLAIIARARHQLPADTQRHRPERHRPRPPQRVKPHPSMAYKG
jgi:predicted PurR-regulated permease PerM